MSSGEVQDTVNRLVSGVLAAALVIAGLAATTVPAAAGCRPSVTDLRLPSGFRAGESARARVMLSCRPRSAVSVRLASGNDDVTLPDAVRVRPGRRGAAFTVTARSRVQPGYAASLTARLDGSVVREKLRVRTGVRLFEITPTSTPNTAILDVVLSWSAPRGGTTISLSSDDPAVTVPETFTFPEGSHGGRVSGIEVHPVAVDTPVTVSVTLGRRTLSDSTTLIAPADPETVGVRLSRQEGGRVYGATYSDQVDLWIDRPAPPGGLSFEWRVRDDDPAAFVGSPHGSISEGWNRDVTSVDFADVTTSHVVVLEVLLGSRVIELPITIHPRVTEIEVPSTVVGGEDFVGTAVLAGPSDVDTVVRLQPSWSIVETPSRVVIPAGQTSAAFTGTTVDVDESSDVFVSGSYGRNRLQSDDMTLLP